MNITEEDRKAADATADLIEKFYPTESKKASIVRSFLEACSAKNTEKKEEIIAFKDWWESKNGRQKQSILLQLKDGSDSELYDLYESKKTNTMKKLTPQILAMYIGFNIQGGSKLTGIHFDSFNRISNAVILNGNQTHTVAIENVKLLLRPISNITEEEDEEWYDISNEFNAGDASELFAEAHRTKYLLSKGFDLFQLIESGEALDITKVNL